MNNPLTIPIEFNTKAVIPSVFSFPPMTTKSAIANDAINVTNGTNIETIVFKSDVKYVESGV